MFLKSASPVTAAAISPDTLRYTVRRTLGLGPDRMMVAWIRALEEERDQRGWSGRDLGGEVHRAG